MQWVRRGRCRRRRAGETCNHVGLRHDHNHRTGHGGALLAGGRGETGGEIYGGGAVARHDSGRLRRYQGTRGHHQDRGLDSLVLDQDDKRASNPHATVLVRHGGSARHVHGHVAVFGGNLQIAPGRQFGKPRD